MSRLPAWIRSSPVLPWVALFLVLGLAVTQYGGTNAMSRTAAMRAVTESLTLRIDDYEDWTVDWARAPDGHLYSNKAPGPVLLGLPIFAVTDAFVLPLAKRDEKGRAPQPGYGQHLALVLWLQLLPFSLLVLYASRRLLERGVPRAAVHLFALASLFGNTAALYMQTNFGHGLAALLFLGAVVFWWEQRYVAAGLLFSWSLLSDYGVAFTLPFFLLATAWRERRLRPLFEIAAGASPGALVWIWYHATCFGSPFRTANQFINPAQIEVFPGSSALGGSFSPVPLPALLYELLFGSSRGLLFTQPWVLAAFALPFVRGIPRGLALFVTGSLCGLLWMNGGFASWHGGWVLGPRYLSSVFPAAAFALALAWTQLPRPARLALWAGLAVALAFRLWVYPFSSLAPNENLWTYHFLLFLASRKKGTIALRFGIALAASALAIFWQVRRGEIRFGTAKT